MGPRKTPLIKCLQRLHVHAYVEMLEMKGIVAFPRQQGDGTIFQQGGATCHTAATTMMLLRDNNVECLRGWPVNSPTCRRLNKSGGS